MRPGQLVPPRLTALQAGLIPIGVALSLVLPRATPCAAEPPTPAMPHLVPVLDAAKGEQAVSAYVAAMTKHCQAGGRSGSSPPAAWADVGLRADADTAALCKVGPQAKALASGALTRSKQDEVLLEVPSGQARALGEKLLVVTRAAPKGYRFARASVPGNGFEARARVVTPGSTSTDALIICDHSGHAGKYPTTCGVFNQGHFSGQGQPGADGETDLLLGNTTLCGPATSLELGKIALREDVVSVEVVVEEGKLEARTPDEGTTACTKRTIKSKKTYSVSYALRADGLRLLTALPKKVRALAQRLLE